MIRLNRRTDNQTSQDTAAPSGEARAESGHEPDDFESASAYAALQLHGWTIALALLSLATILVTLFTEIPHQ
jgi:hypothetical protein